MFELLDPELAAMLADDALTRATLPAPDEPQWTLQDAVCGAVPVAEQIADCLNGQPGPGRLMLLAALDPQLLSAGQQIDLVAALEQHKAWLEAVQHRALAAIERADNSAHGWSQELVSCALRLPGLTAQRRLKSARTLLEDLPRTLAALHAGTIGPRHAELIIEASWNLPTDLTGQFESLVLDRAAEQTPPALRRTIGRAAITLDPATAEQRHHHAAQHRAVRKQPDQDGMAELRAYGPAADIETLYGRLDAAARLLPTTDDRNRDQQRFDLLIDGLLTGIPHHTLPHAQGRRPTIQVIVSASTLLGLDDQPADLAGYGAITADTARQLATDPTGTWRRLLTDPNTGHLLDAGQDSYRPSMHLIDFLHARDGTCSFPTCNQPSHRCDIEHCRPYDHHDPTHGGPTRPDNTALACHRHNTCKNTHGPWTYTINHDHSFTWTHHTGHNYTSRPPQRWTTPHPP